MTLQEFRQDKRAQRKTMVFLGVGAILVLWLLHPWGTWLMKLTAAPQVVQQAGARPVSKPGAPPVVTL
jgi:hypothetical protein